MQSTNKRDIIVLVSLFIVLIVLVIVGEYRARTMQITIAEGNAALAAGAAQNGEGQNAQNAESIRWQNTVAFFKYAAILTVVFLLSLAILITIIVFLVRIIPLHKKSQAPPSSPPKEPPSRP